MDQLIAAHSTEDSAMRTVWRYQPFVPAAVALAIGITFDRHRAVSAVAGLVFTGSALLVWGVVNLWSVRNRSGRSTQIAGWISSIVLLTAIAAIGASWHHVYWNVYATDDIGHWARREAHPARIRGVIAEEPLEVAAGRRDPMRAWQTSARTLSAIEVESIRTSDQWAPASGRVHLVADGRLNDFRAGDRVEVLGELVAPVGASNPGEFDYREYLRGRRTRAILRCNRPESIRAAPGDRVRSVGLSIQRIAGAAERLLVSRLPADQAEIAVALLLGRYELMEEDVTELFIRTGTMHILAVSGQHLAILAGFIWLVLRLLPIPRKWGATGLGLIVIAYALLTGARPPVLRSAVLVCVLVGAILLDARSRRANPLALALTIVLALNPSDLFDRGLQLSFLAVGALFWIVQPAWNWLQGNPDPLEQLVAEARPLGQRITLAAVRLLVSALVMSGVVWLSNVPLLAARFHMFSPVVVPLTVILTPVVTVALIAGLGLLLVDPWSPGLGAIFAKLCGWGVAAMEWCVRVGSQVPGGYWYVVGPPDWWVAGFYVGLACVLLFRPTGRGRWRWATGCAAWVALGFAVPALRPSAGDLECQVLAVGNGSAAVLRLPNGRVIIADAGQIAGPRVGSRLIAPALWDAGISRIDAVFISHADVDHFNGLPHLVERFPIGAVFVPPHFAHTNQEAVRLTCDQLARRGVPICVCWEGDRFEPSPGVVLRVLHPPAEFGGSDNEQSLVLAVEYLGKSILLTGDLEGAGLRRLLASEPLDVDVLVAPHHGSGRANPAGLAEWCRPELVVVSQGKPRSGATMDTYRQAGIPVLSTNEKGAIALRFDAAGFRVQTNR